MTKVFISAGEASGDLHAAALTRAILQQDPTAQVFGMGGDALAAAGGQVVFNYKDYSVMGFVEVLQALPRLLGLKKAFRRLMEERKPDVFVTVDYPDFNMRVAKEAKKLGIPVFSYIPPSAWAWRRGGPKTWPGWPPKWPASTPLQRKSTKRREPRWNLWGIRWWTLSSPP